MLPDDLKGEGVTITLRQYDDFITYGIRSTHIYARIVEVDDRVGIWVKNPRWSPRRVRPAEEDESHLPHILIRWEYVVGIMRFPGHEYPAADEDTEAVGYLA